MFSNKDEESALDKARERNFQPAAMDPYSPFWSFSSKKLLYSVQSRSTNPSSAGSMGKDYSKAVIKNMIKAGVL